MPHLFLFEECPSKLVELPRVCNEWLAGSEFVENTSCLPDIPAWGVFLQHRLRGIVGWVAGQDDVFKVRPFRFVDGDATFKGTDLPNPV